MLAAKYVIQRREADRNRGFQKTDYYVTKDFEGPDGQKYTKGQPLKLNDQAFSLLQKQGLTGNLVSGTLYGKMLDNATEVEKAKIKNAAKGLDDYYQKTPSTLKVTENMEIEVYYPTVEGRNLGLKTRPAGGVNAWKSVTRGYMTDLNAIAKQSNAIDEAIAIIKKGDALGVSGLIGNLSEATKAVVPKRIGEDVLGLNYNELASGQKLENLNRIMALQMSRIILNEGGKMISNQERQLVAKALGFKDATLEGTGANTVLNLGSYSNVFTSEDAAIDALEKVQRILIGKAKEQHEKYAKLGDNFGYSLTGVEEAKKEAKKTKEAPKTVTGRFLTQRKDGKYVISVPE